MRSKMKITVILVAVIGLGACGNSGKAPGKESADATPPTNRIDLPTSVRQNLGITWAKARRGRLTRFHSVPGEIIARPDHAWTLHAPLPGTVTTVARRWQAVKAGDVVVEIASPVLAEWQAELYAGRARASEARMALSRARAEIEPGRALADTLARVAKDAGEAVTRSQAALEGARRVADAADVRLAEVLGLRESGAVSAATLLSAQRDALALKRGVNDAARVLRVTRVEAAEDALKAATARARADGTSQRLALLAAQLSSSEAAFQQRLEALAAVSGMTMEALSVVEKEAPAWARMRVLPLRSPATGVVVEVRSSAGTWVGRDEVLVKILDSAFLRFRALIPEADLARFPEALSGTIEASGIEGVFDLHEAAVRPVAEASTRSVLLEAEVMNPDGKLRVGTSATARILMSRSASEEVLVPLVCVVRDGLESVVYRRDPANADRVIRTVVTLGDSSAGWAEVIAGVGSGDQLVEDGVHQLRQTGLGKASASGHFHADGTWHTGDK